MSNEWCFNNKMFFATDRVVQETTGDEPKRKNEKL